jgi:PhnB protein
VATTLNPYISFAGDARAAMERYREIFGGDLTLSTFGDFGQAGTPIENLIMHGMLHTPSGLTLMGADTPPGMDHQPGGAITISLSGDDEAELRTYWDGLSEGGAVTLPLERQMWGDLFGQCTDRFGVSWMVNIGTTT